MATSYALNIGMAAPYVKVIIAFFDPRISLTGSAEVSLGLGNYDQNSWGLGVGLRFARDGLRRGLELELDTRLVSLDDGRSSDVGIRGEAGYGMWGGPLFGTMRPYMGLVRYQDDNSLRRTLGLDLRDTPDSRINVEVYDHPGDRLRALNVTFRCRFLWPFGSSPSSAADACGVQRSGHTRSRIVVTTTSGSFWDIAGHRWTVGRVGSTVEG